MSYQIKKKSRITPYPMDVNELTLGHAYTRALSHLLGRVPMITSDNVKQLNFRKGDLGVWLSIGKAVAYRVERRESISLPWDACVLLTRTFKSPFFQVLQVCGIIQADPKDMEVVTMNRIIQHVGDIDKAVENYRTTVNQIEQGVKVYKKLFP